MNSCKVCSQNLSTARLPPCFLLFRASLKLYAVTMTLAKLVQKTFPGLLLTKFSFCCRLCGSDETKTSTASAISSLLRGNPFAEYRLTSVTMVPSSPEVRAVRGDRMSSLFISLYWNVDRGMRAMKDARR